MSMCNSADLIIEIKLKNNAVIKAKMYVSGYNLDPLGASSYDLPVTPSIKEINSGDMLLQHIYKSYFPYSSDHWSDDDDFRFDSDQYRSTVINDYEKIVNITDFHIVKEITIKEKFEWDEDSAIDQFIIDSTNCPFIDDQPILCENELRKHKPTLPSSVTFIGKNAFSGCNNLNIFVEENTPAHLCLKKYGMPHYVINQETPTTETLPKNLRTLHCPYEMPNYYLGCDYDVLRIVTKEDIYVLFVEFAEEFPIENVPNACFGADDYMPEIVGGKLIWGDIEIKSVVELLTALFFVLSDVIDFEMLKTYLNYSSGKIISKDAIESFINCHESGYMNAFEKGSFDEINNLNLSSMNEAEQKIAILNVVEEKFKCLIPNFQELIEPFVKVCNSINEISDILYAEASHGVIGYNELEDEELWEGKKLDFGLLNKKREPLVMGGVSCDITKKPSEIEYLNEESGIENNFNGSFEEISLGDTENIKLESIDESKTTQSYSETKTSTCKEKSQNDYIVKSNIDAMDINKNKKYEEAKALMKKTSSADVKKARASFSNLGEYLDSAKYLVECDALISELEVKEEAEAEKARKREAAAKKAAFEAQPNQKRKKAVKEGDKKIADFKAVVEAEAKKRIEEISKAKNAIIEAKIEKANQKSSEKQSLGFFAFGKKSNLTCEINALNNEIATLRQQLESEKQSISEKAKSAKSQYTRAINQYIEKRFIPDYGCNDSDIKLAKEIIKAIEGADGEGATLSYVLRYKDIFRDNSINKISRIMDALVDKGFLNKTTKNRVSYFRVASKNESFDWKENPNLANTPLPEPPSIDSIFS